MLTTRRALAALAAFAALSCGDFTGSGNGSTAVSVRFALAGASGASGAVSGASAALSTDPLLVQGSNGTLTINEVAMVVSHVEFEQADDACEVHAAGGKSEKSEGRDEKDEDDEECEEFNTPPALLHMSLPGGATVVATDKVPTGTWTTLKFRVKNVDFDDDDDDDSAENAQLLNLLTAVRAEFPDWPRKANFVVKGSFLPTGAAAASNFTTFFNGEIKVKMPLVPPLVISSTGASREVVVELDPAMWFKLADGKVFDLSAFDFARTKQLLEFRGDTKKGFVRVKSKH